MISEMFQCGQICIILKYGTFSITEGFLHCRGSSLPPDTHGSARQEKVPSEDSDSAGMQTPLWPGLRSLCVPPPLLTVSLPVPPVPHIHGFHSPSVEVEPPALFSVSSLCAFVHCFPSSRLACPAVEKYRDYGPVVMSPRLTLLFSGPVDEE